MFDSPSAPAKMPLQTLPHYAPANARSIANGSVRVFDAQYALFDKVKHFAVERGLKTVGDVPGKLLLQMDRPLADRSVEADRLRHRITPLAAGEMRVSLTFEYVTDPTMRLWRRVISNMKDAVAYFGFRQVFRRNA